MSSGGIRFETESSIEERQKQTQEEWERVRKESDPLLAPEVEVCNKSLFEQLQENRGKRDEEFEESRKFKNHFRGLEEEETTFLSEVEVQSRKQRSNLDSELKSLIEQNKNVVIENLAEPVIETPVVSFSTQKLGKKDETKAAGLKSLVVKKRLTSDLSSLVKPKFQKFEETAEKTSSNQFTDQEKDLLSEKDRKTECLKSESDVKVEESEKVTKRGDVIVTAGLSALASYVGSDSDISDSD